ncbi:MAG: 7-carboxy-7-deazaguanine synthase QueE [Planctomycetota bacterium]|jgi:organic radical activating enzyme
MNTAPLYEVFSSVQGEASHVGERHIFVRMAGCDLECVYCDTPASRRVPQRARIFLPSGAREEENPLDRDTLDWWVTHLDEEAGPHHAIAITGGEPLLFGEYLRPVAEGWRGRGHRVLLETGGHLPSAMEAALRWVDIVMADVKIASSAGFSVDLKTARNFLRFASQKECAVKVVVSAHTTPEEIRGVAAVVAEHAPRAPLVLQPVTGSKFDAPRGERMLELQRIALAIHRDTRVIPQTQKILRVR